MTPWRFAHVTDIHVGSPRSFRFAPAMNDNWQTARRQIIQAEPELLLVGGDVARDGTLHRYELENVKADFASLPFPAHVVAGNMDTGNKHTEVCSPREDRDDVALNLTSGQVRQWEDVFGPAQWTFTHRGVRFSGFCDMILGSGLPEEPALWEWLEQVAALPPARLHVWMLHSAVFVDDPQEPNWDITDPDHYHNWYFGLDDPHRARLLKLLADSGASLVLSGHVHCRHWSRANGIDFHINPSTAFPQWGNRWPDGDDTLGFVVYEVGESGITSRFVPLAETSRREGYGPGGHPLPHERDYSIAWEQNETDK
ncbi:MAG: metallophosphoesterase family protein [Armatimonadota bacterium]